MRHQLAAALAVLLVASCATAVETEVPGPTASVSPERSNETSFAPSAKPSSVAASLPTPSVNPTPLVPTQSPSQNSGPFAFACWLDGHKTAWVWVFADAASASRGDCRSVLTPVLPLDPNDTFQTETQAPVSKPSEVPHKICEFTSRAGLYIVVSDTEKEHKWGDVLCSELKPSAQSHLETRAGMTATGPDRPADDRRGARAGAPALSGGRMKAWIAGPVQPLGASGRAVPSHHVTDSAVPAVLVVA